MPETGIVARLGASGDGVVGTDDGGVFVPYTLPGESVAFERAGQRGHLLAVEAASAERAAPFCPHFGRCGGCVAQHMAPGLYQTWKRDAVVAALARAGLTPPIEPLADAHGTGRRRVTLHARRVDGVMRVGFMEARSHRLVPIELCPVTVPGLAVASAIAALLAEIVAPVGKPVDVAVTATDVGLDVDLRGSGAIGEPLRQRLIAAATTAELARLSLHGEVLVERRSPFIPIGRANVVPPPGVFLQATVAGEAYLADAVLTATVGAKRVADLFAGIGPFALRLAERAAVHAVDSDGPSLAALDRAARGSPGLRRVTTEGRDLFRRPLLAQELAAYDAVVLDPPRSGAESQVRQLVLSSQATVVMVSCDPGTFARDAATLAGGGFVVERVLPVDQFKWSAHVEIVGVFRRPRRPRRR